MNSMKKRISIDLIKNRDDWDKGFKMGYPLWQKGEEKRKAGAVEEAINYYDKARAAGYLAPALYNSYALAFRKIKNLDEEIDILREGIYRMEGDDSCANGVRKMKEQLRKAEEKRRVK